MLPAIAHSRYRMLSERYLFFSKVIALLQRSREWHSENDESMLQPDRMMWVRKENRQQFVRQKYVLWTDSTKARLNVRWRKATKEAGICNRGSTSDKRVGLGGAADLADLLHAPLSLGRNHIVSAIERMHFYVQYAGLNDRRLQRLVVALLKEACPEIQRVSLSLEKRAQTEVAKNCLILLTESSRAFSFGENKHNLKEIWALLELPNGWDRNGSFCSSRSPWSNFFMCRSSFILPSPWFPLHYGVSPYLFPNPPNITQSPSICMIPFFAKRFDYGEKLPIQIKNCFFFRKDYHNMSIAMSREKVKSASNLDHDLQASRTRSKRIRVGFVSKFFAEDEPHGELLEGIIGQLSKFRAPKSVQTKLEIENNSFSRGDAGRLSKTIDVINHQKLFETIVMHIASPGRSVSRALSDAADEVVLLTLNWPNTLGLLPLYCHN